MRYLSLIVTSRKSVRDQTGISSESNKEITTLCRADRTCIQTESVSPASGRGSRVLCAILPIAPAGNTRSNSEINLGHLHMNELLYLAVNKKYALNIL